MRRHSCSHSRRKCVTRPSSGWVPLTLELADLAGALDLAVDLVVAVDLVLHDWVVDDVVDGPPDERQHAVERTLHDALDERVGRGPGVGRTKRNGSVDAHGVGIIPGRGGWGSKKRRDQVSGAASGAGAAGSGAPVRAATMRSTWTWQFSMNTRYLS